MRTAPERARRSGHDDPAPWRSIATAQCGVVARPQVLGCGVTSRRIEWLLSSGRWRRLLPGVFVVHRGPVSAEARVWAFLLYCGQGAVAAGRTALWLWKVFDEPPAVTTVHGPGERRVRRRPGLVVWRSKDLPQSAHPAATPPRLRVEEAVLDVAGGFDRPWDAVDVVLRAAQRRVTTAARIEATLARRKRHRWRALLELVLEDVVVGVLSGLERQYLRTVERAHRLPPGEYNPGERVRERRRDRRRYRDVRYRLWNLVVELDGAEAHPPEDGWADHERDNAVTRAGRSSLRYGWRPVADDPCGVAAEVADSLRVRGWGGLPTPCGPGCRVLDLMVETSPRSDVEEFPT